MVSRVFVEKRPGFDVEAQHIRVDLTENLGISTIKDLRILNRYDISGLSEKQFLEVRNTILSDPATDVVYDETGKFSPEEQVFAIEYLPGQYDQRADSAAQCVQLLTQKERPTVATARVIAIKGNISEKELNKIKDYLVNPVESRIASMEKPESLEIKAEVPANVARVTGFILWSEEEISSYYGKMGFAMSLEDLKFCREYFRNEEKRDPTVTELKVIDTYWSDHCRHTTFSTCLDYIEIEKSETAVSEALKLALKTYYQARKDVYGADSKRAVSLMDMAVIGMKKLRQQGKISDLDISEEINACSIEVPVAIDGKMEKWLVQFKNETHNHPTEIEPFGGAATCLGGAIRDPLSGRAYVYQAMRVTGSGDPRIPFENTRKGKLPTRKITTGAAQGYSSYGNQIGLATGQVTEIYDPGYVAKRMEIGAVIGACPKKNVVREEPKCGDVIVLLGGATGRDGCGGATGSSKAHTLSSIETCGAEVQKGNPPTERKIQRFFRNEKVSSKIKRCNDFGAGGVCVAIGELADGLNIDLNCIPKKYEGLDGTELAISESQERMAVVLAPEDVEEFCKQANKENLSAVKVAEVTEKPRLKMMWRDDCIVNISRAFLDTNGVTQHTDVFIKVPNLEDDYRHKVPECLKKKSLADAFTKNLARLEVCGQKGLSERFDASIGAGSVLIPFAGKYQLTPEEGMVAKIPVLHGDTDDASAMSFGFIPGISKFSPFHGAAYAVTESLSKICAMGADPMKSRLTFQEYFECLRDEPERWGKPAAALLGALTAQLKLGVPAIGGKDSMSGSFESLDVPPTLVSFAVSMTKASKTISAAAKDVSAQLVLLPLPENQETHLPNWDLLPNYYSGIYSLIEKGEIVAASVIKEGGVAAAVAKMLFGNKLGFIFDKHVQNKQFLFSPQSGSILAQMRVGAQLPHRGVLVGVTTLQPQIVLDGEKLSMDSVIDTWNGTLEKIFPNKTEAILSNTKLELYTKRFSKSPAVHTAKPRVIIPVFPGTNCEYDTARAFEKAGAHPQVLVIRNRTASDIEQAVEELEKAIRSSQIIMIPGGFSGGDEPDGSGKFIATTFRNPAISEAVADFLENRDGLMLGICNGFQALIKLGLVPYGKITPPSVNSPTLTFNTLGRHVSRMVYTRVSSVKSPWLAAAEAGELFTIPVSHGEGRFWADEETVRRLAANGQVATQYVTPDGEISGDVLWNPNGSVCAIEGITSPDGRVFGKMGHSERNGKNLYFNVPGEKDQKLFVSGVKYFK